MAISNTTDLADVIEKRVSAIVTETLIQESVMLGAVMDLTSQIGPGMDTLKVPLFTELAVQDVSESADMTPQSILVATADLVLDRHKSIPFAISDLASIQSKANLIDMTVRNGARSLAAEIDDRLLSQLDSGASTAAPDHRRPITADSLADLALAKKLLDDANVPKAMRFVVAAPAFVQLLLGNNNIINVDKYGSENPIMAGFVSRIYGFTILESSSASIIDGGFIAYHRDTIGFARQISPKFERQRQVLGQKDDFALTHLYGSINLDSAGTRIVVFDSDGT